MASRLSNWDVLWSEHGYIIYRDNELSITRQLHQPPPPSLTSGWMQCCQVGSSKIQPIICHHANTLSVVSIQFVDYFLRDKSVDLATLSGWEYCIADCYWEISDFDDHFLTYATYKLMCVRNEEKKLFVRNTLDFHNPSLMTVCG